jgi:subtilisin family serine protease
MVFLKLRKYRNNKRWDKAMPTAYDFLNKFGRELDGSTTLKGITIEEANEYYYNEDYETYFVEYIGEFVDRISTIGYAHILVINLFFALLFVRKGKLSELLKGFPEITNIERSFPYTLLNLNESNELPDLTAIIKGDIPLDGEGVIVGIIGTGIDFLNPRFMDENGNTRIISIWDQSISDGPIPRGFFQGTEYTREQINRAIQAKNLGNDPYTIVKHRDEVGYGTEIATIIGGRGLTQADRIVGIAPKCEFVIIKLKEASNLNRAHWGLENYNGLVFDSIDIAGSGRYLNLLQQRLNKPTVMYMTVGTNLGAHDGSTLGERYVNFFTQGRTFSVVTSTGDQGGSPICYKGNFSNDESEKAININVDENQENLFFSIYYREPDRISVGIMSPSGESIDKIQINPINGESINISLGQSSIFVQFFLEGRFTGDKRLDFVIRNAVGGIWTINIKKEFSVRGEVNMWLQQKEFSVGTTGILQSTPYTTLMTPATANNIIVTSSYNQINNMVTEESGRGFTSDNRIIPSVSLASKNIVSVGLNNKPAVVSGSAVSGAILVGIVTLLYQWGIVLGNDLNMYYAKIKSYLIQGTVRELDKVYPNPELGFGVLDIETLFKSLYERKEEGLCNNMVENPTLYIKIPTEVYKKLEFYSDKN